MYVKSILSSIINGVRVDTMEIRFPRIILPEFNTHRVFSRNFQSNRAKPISKVIAEDLTYNPSDYGWRIASKGMSPSEIITDENKIFSLNSSWLNSKEKAIESAKYLEQENIAKEIVNRVLEPYMEVTGIVTSTEWNNFFTLRSDKGAQSEIRVLSDMMKDTYNSVIPIARDYHLPYTNENVEIDINNRIKQSVARCARVSYFSFDKKESELEKDIELYERLKTSKHLSPFEHIVLNEQIANSILPRSQIVSYEDNNGNFSDGVIQFRKLIEKGFNI